MATITQEFEAGALNALAAAITANPGVIETLIQTGEADAQALLVTLFKNIPAVKGFAAVFVGPAEAAIEAGVNAYVASFIAAHTPAEVETLIVAYITALAAKV